MSFGTLPTPASSDSPDAPGYQFGKDEQEHVNAFFASIRVAYGNAKYNAQFADNKDLAVIKRFWAPRVLEHSKADLLKAIQTATARRLRGDARFDWPDIAAILSILTEQPESSDADWEHARIAHADARNRDMLELPAPRPSPEVHAAGLAKVRAVLNS